MCSCFFIFFLQRLPTVSFSSSFSPSPLSLHILHNSSFFLFTKTSLSSLFLSLSDSHFLKLLHLLQWHPRPRSPSTSFLLMHSTSPVGKGGGEEIDGASTINIPARESHPYGWICNFSNFSHFSSFSFIFHFNVFFCHVNAWVLLWDRSRWKASTLGEVGTCLGLILDDVCLKTSKKCSCLCFYVRGLGPAYAALFLHTHVCSWDSTYVGVGLRTWGPVCVHGLWPAYVRRLVEALLYPFSFLFQLFHFYMQS